MTQAASAPPVVWDRHAIKAEVYRQGMTLTGIARDAGLAENACRKALFGIDRKGAEALSSALGIPFDTLFPAGFHRSRSSQRHATKKQAQESRQKRIGAADKARARA
ncbi:MAG: helix-turn-helix domain-containing protein [Methylobacterium sp.]|uniref:helix-turn-helix domain-containing protein n=1 Tax=Methylobacterium sp. TaxID=409 RepID=UPI0025D00E3A|nr:helix-turn-helix domain-containing protein [Methylobacterium sp.]MBX9933314.1 helix-turn-helix domain-containing protein [Methylobacterium sp.]MBY0322526.1 helix-turn-helix domain-containing protein [Reyranella sp.]